jgi:hypothetical protein
VGFVDGEEGNGNAPEPGYRVLPSQPFRRQIEQAPLALTRFAHDFLLLRVRLRAVQHGCRNAHLG